LENNLTTQLLQNEGFENPFFESHVTKPLQLDGGLIVGGDSIIMMAGPCAVENYDQVRITAEAIANAGGKIIRGGAFKPRTSPHSFQGLGMEGLEILRAVADEFGLLVISEALGVEHVELVAEFADIIQIGSRNMQHYPLLWSVGKLNKPVLLKRGFMSTIDEWLSAAEHISSRGNQQILLCERGIRTFETATRNTLDSNAIALVKQESPYPVLADPSHATGRRDLVLPAALSAIAAGADGLLVEFHPHPADALSDGEQSLPVSSLPNFYLKVGKVAAAVGRKLI
jgi:3-deoxy-7-phosphoheptulonate synthase